MKRRITTIIVALSTLSLLALGITFLGSKNSSLVPRVQAQESTQTERATASFRRRCNLGSVNGTYAYQASGTIVQPIPQLQIPAGPYAVNGLITLDYGNFTFKSTQSFNGIIVPSSGTGTYKVNADCTGSAVDNIGTPYNFVITDGGDELKIILTIPGTVITGTARRL